MDIYKLTGANISVVRPSGTPNPLINLYYPDFTEIGAPEGELVEITGLFNGTRTSWKWNQCATLPSPTFEAEQDECIIKWALTTPLTSGDLEPAAYWAFKPGARWTLYPFGYDVYNNGDGSIPRIRKDFILIYAHQDVMGKFPSLEVHLTPTHPGFLEAPTTIEGTYDEDNGYSTFPIPLSGSFLNSPLITPLPVPFDLELREPTWDTDGAQLDILVNHTISGRYSPVKIMPLMPEGVTNYVNTTNTSRVTYYGFHALPFVHFFSGNILNASTYRPNTTPTFIGKYLLNTTAGTRISAPDINLPAANYGDSMNIQARMLLGGTPQRPATALVKYSRIHIL